MMYFTNPNQEIFLDYKMCVCSLQVICRLKLFSDYVIDFNQKYHARVQQNSLTHQKLFRLKLLISFCIIKARYFCLFGTAVCSQFHHAQAHCKHRSCTIMLASFYNKRSYKSNGSPSFLFKSEFLVCSWMPAYLRKTILILLI